MTLDWLWSATGWLLLAFWLVHLVPLWPLLAWGTLRRRTQHLNDPQAWPAVSIIVPARNEGPHVEAAVRSLLALDYPALELMVINDRSTDDTGTILDRVSAENPRLRVVHVTELPAGWLGKNHAMHLGAGAARGEYLLFTDGDVLFEPDTLRLALKHVLHRQVDHLCLIPHLIPGSYWENVATTGFAFLFMAATRPWLIPSRWKGAYCGVGAFNLVRRTTYDAVGGFERLRLDVLDDVHLGRMIKQSGYRQDVLVSGGAISVRWQESLWGVIRGLEKNGFATLDYSVAKLVIVSAVLLVMLALPYAGLCLGSADQRLPFALTVLLIHLTYGFQAHCAGASFTVAPMLPVGWLLMIFTLWRSAVITLRQGGVRWRDTLYPLEQLRAACRSSRVE